MANEKQTPMQQPENAGVVQESTKQPLEQPSAAASPEKLVKPDKSVKVPEYIVYLGGDPTRTEDTIHAVKPEQDAQ